MEKYCTFGEFLRKKRRELKLPIRKVAAFLDIDPSTLSKIERGERSPLKSFIPAVSKIFNENEEELLILYHSDKIAKSIFQENCSGKILKLAEEKIEYLKANKITQAEMDFNRLS